MEGSVVAQVQLLLRAAVASCLAVLLASPARATDWGPREDVGVAAVDTRTGKVLWEAWRPEEVPAGAAKEEKAAAEYLLAALEHAREPLPRVAQLPDTPVKELGIKEPWPPGWDVFGPYAS